MANFIYYYYKYLYNNTITRNLMSYLNSISQKDVLLIITSN